MVLATIERPATTKADASRLQPRELPAKPVRSTQMNVRIDAGVESIRDVATIAPVTLVECELAHILHKQHADFEYNLIMASAHTCQAEYVVTYDERMARDFPGDCLTPRQALGLLGREGVVTGV